MAHPGSRFVGLGAVGDTSGVPWAAFVDTELRLVVFHLMGTAVDVEAEVGILGAVVVVEDMVSMMTVEYRRFGVVGLTAVAFATDMDVEAAVVVAGRDLADSGFALLEHQRCRNNILLPPLESQLFQILSS